MDENADFLSQGSKGSSKKSSTKKEKIETLETEEVVAIDLTKIDNALIKGNVTEEVLAQIKTFKDIVVNGVEDKEAYKLANDSRKFCMRLRGLTVDVCKEGRSIAIAEQRAWVSKEKEIVAKIREVEDYLESQVKIVDDEKKRIKEAAEKAEQMRIQTRTMRLSDLGMKLQGDNYVLDTHIITVIHVKLYNDFDFEGLVAPVEAYAKTKAEEKAKEDARLKQLQEDQEKERLRLDAQQKQIDEDKAKIEAEKKALADAKIKNRKTSLFALGFSQQHDTLLFKEVSISDKEVGEMEDTAWLAKLEDFTAKSAVIKERIEKERLAEIQRQKDAAIQAERDRVAAEQAAKDKAATEALEKAQADAKRAEELKPDQEKYDTFIKNVQALIIPEFGTEEYKALGKYMQETRDKMVNHFNKEKLTRIK